MPRKIETFQRIGDHLAEIIKNTGSEKRLLQLERASRFETFRLTLLRLVKENIAQGSQTPLITLDDYFEDLFPEGALTWRETRDIVLFRIYEVLHDWLIEQNLVPQTNETEEDKE